MSNPTAFTSRIRNQFSFTERLFWWGSNFKFLTPRGHITLFLNITPTHQQYTSFERISSTDHDGSVKIVI